MYRGAFHLARFALGMFNLLLKNQYKELYGSELELNLYCKPETVTFDYAIKHL